MLPSVWCEGEVNLNLNKLHADEMHSKSQWTEAMSTVCFLLVSSHILATSGEMLTFFKVSHFSLADATGVGSGNLSKCTSKLKVTTTVFGLLLMPPTLWIPASLEALEDNAEFRCCLPRLIFHHMTHPYSPDCSLDDLRVSKCRRTSHTHTQTHMFIAQ